VMLFIHALFRSLLFHTHQTTSLLVFVFFLLCCCSPSSAFSFLVDQLICDYE
jgi:hypothetical protein